MEKNPNESFEKAWFGGKPLPTKPLPKPQPQEKDVLYPMREGQTTKPQPPPKLQPSQQPQPPQPQSNKPQPPPKLQPQQQPQPPQSNKPPPPPKLQPTKQEAVVVMQQAQQEVVREVTKDIRSEFDDLLSQLESGQTTDDENVPETGIVKPLPFTPPQKQEKQKVLQEVRNSPALAKNKAQDRLDGEDNAFDERKATRHADKKLEKIVEQQNKAKQEKEQPVLEHVSELAKKGTLDKISDYAKNVFDSAPWSDKDDKKEKKEKGALDDAIALKKEKESLDKLNDLLLTPLEGVGKADKVVSKGVSMLLPPDNSGVAIAADSGSILSSGAALGQNLANAFTSFKAYSDTKDPSQEAQCLDAGMRALGGAMTNLVNVTKGALDIADKCGATQVAEAIPILGLVAVVPTLLEEMYDLQDAARRFKKQKKILKQLKNDPEANPTLVTTLESLMDRDKEEIAKGMARICLDCTKIAGHAVSAGGITGAAGPALTGIAMVGKQLISTGTSVETLYDAHKANKAEKKIEKGGTASEMDHEASKVINRRPQLAAQIVIDQAVLELESGTPDGPAFKVLRSFGIKEKQIKCGLGDSEDAICNIQSMRQLMVLKLNAKDKQEETLMQKLDKVENYLSFKVKNEELEKYNDAKNLIGELKGGKTERSWLNLALKNIKIEDVEEHKEKLRNQVEILLGKEEVKNDAEAVKKLNEAKELLKANPMEKKDRVLRKLNLF